MGAREGREAPRGPCSGASQKIALLLALIHLLAALRCGWPWPACKRGHRRGPAAAGLGMRVCVPRVQARAAAAQPAHKSRSIRHMRAVRCLGLLGPARLSSSLVAALPTAQRAKACWNVNAISCAHALVPSACSQPRRGHVHVPAPSTRPPASDAHLIHPIDCIPVYEHDAECCAAFQKRCDATTWAHKVSAPLHLVALAKPIDAAQLLRPTKGRAPAGCRTPFRDPRVAVARMPAPGPAGALSCPTACAGGLRWGWLALGGAHWPAGGLTTRAVGCAHMSAQGLRTRISKARNTSTSRS